MRTSQSVLSEYRIKEAALLLEVDYACFQKQATSLINEEHDEESKKQWVLFCQHLNTLNEKKPEKLMLMQRAFLCFANPLTNSDLAQFITLSMHLKTSFGSGLYRQILEAAIPEPQRQMQNYLTLMQLLVEMQEVAGISDSVKKGLSDLPKLLGDLQVMHYEQLLKTYPKRDIDSVIERFATKDEITSFPLKKEELVRYREDYLAIEAKMKAIKTWPQTTLKNLFLEQGRLFRANGSSDHRQMLIAIMAEAIRRLYRISPYDTQILALLALIDTPPAELKGRIAQIKTGEGKSTLMCMLAGFMGSQGYFVDIITSADYLSIRDCEHSMAFFIFLGLKASHISHLVQQQQHFHAQILYGTNSDYAFSLMRDKLNGSELRYSYRLGETQLTPRPFEVLLVDEIDNMTLDNLGAARMGIHSREDYSWVYEFIIDFVKLNLKNKPLTKNTPIELRAFLQKRLSNTQFTILKSISDTALSRWLKSTQIALYQMKEKRDFSVKDDIVPLDYTNTGRPQDGCHWQGGITQILQAEFGLKITPESLTGASISHPTLFAKYPKIFGLTGTMGELVEREEVQEVYGVGSFDVPPHFPSQGKTLNPQILANTKKQTEALIAILEDKKNAQRPILILWESVEESNSFDETLRQRGIAPRLLLNTEQRESEDYIVARSGEAKMRLVATTVASRGTNIIVSPEALDAGGLLVILTFLPSTLRGELQCRGRTARQGQKGDSCLVLRADDLRIHALLQSCTDPLLLKQWMTASSDEERVNCLYQIRSKKIQKESKQRRYKAAIESLYFSYLNEFFDLLKSLRNNLDDPDFQKNMQAICDSNTEPTDDRELIDLEAPNWVVLYRTARALLSHQHLGKTIDWTAFMDQFKESFVNDQIENWSSFYSELPIQVEGMQVEQAKVWIDQGYAKLNLQASCNSEAALRILAYLIHKATVPQSLTMTPETRRPHTSFFSPKPDALYEKALLYYKAKKYQKTLKCCAAAIEGYKLLKGESCLAIATCYSTQASCYRELGHFPESLTLCEQAIAIIDSQKGDSNKDDSMQRILVKYQECLLKSKLDVSILYPQAVAQFKEKQFRSAAYKLLYLVEKMPSLTLSQKGSCYSTLASCYRDLAEKDKAIEACEVSMKYFKDARQPAKAEEVSKKLKGLMQVDSSIAVLK